MFKTIGIVFRYEFMNGFRRRGYLFMTFGISLLALVAFFGYLFISGLSDEQEEPQDPLNFSDYDPVGYVDPAAIFPPPDVPPFKGKVIKYPDEATAEEAIEQGKIKAYYVVSEDYLQTGHVDLVTETFSLEYSEQRDLFRAFVLNTLLQNNSAATQLYIRLQQPSDITRHQVTKAGEASTRNEDTDFLLAYLFSMTLLASTITSSGYLMQSVVEERETRMIEILISSIRPTPLLVGKILAMGLLGLVQIIVWLSVGVFIASQAAENFVDLSHLEISASTLAISLAYFLGGYLLLGSGFAAIGALSNNMREGPQLATFLTLPAVSPLWVMALLIDNPNGNVATILSFIPITAPMTMVIRASVIDIPLWQVVVSLALLSITIVLMMWMAGRLFRIGSLLAGTMPRLRDIPRLLFG